MVLSGARVSVGSGESLGRDSSRSCFSPWKKAKPEGLVSQCGFLFFLVGFHRRLS